MEAKGMVWYGLEANGMEWNGMECMGVIIPEIAKQKYVLKNYPQLGQSLVLLPSSILARQNNWLVQPQMWSICPDAECCLLAVCTFHNGDIIHLTATASAEIPSAIIPHGNIASWGRVPAHCQVSCCWLHSSAAHWKWPWDHGMEWGSSMGSQMFTRKKT